MNSFNSPINPASSLERVIGMSVQARLQVSPDNYIILESAKSSFHNTGTVGQPRSGLIEKVKASTLDEAAAEQQLLEFIARYIPKHGSPMCGNTIGQDRRFLVKFMPKLEAYFHYRNLDVSTLKELAKRWKPAAYNAFKKQQAHTALADVHESIEELAHYRDTFLRLQD